MQGNLIHQENVELCKKVNLIGQRYMKLEKKTKALVWLAVENKIISSNQINQFLNEDNLDRLFILNTKSFTNSGLWNKR